VRSVDPILVVCYRENDFDRFVRSEILCDLIFGSEIALKRNSRRYKIIRLFGMLLEILIQLKTDFKFCLRSIILFFMFTRVHTKKRVAEVFKNLARYRFS